MAFGLGVLRLPPAVFWSMTPRELEAAMAGARGPLPAAARLQRDDLLALMRTFPDAGGALS